MTLPELIDKWKEIKFETKAWVNNLQPKYRIGTTIYTQLNQILFHIVNDLENLQKHTGAITESAHFANTMLGEVPQVGHSNNSERSQADSSETSVVGQNEQTKEVCKHCKSKYIQKIKGRISCRSCGRWWFAN